MDEKRKNLLLAEYGLLAGKVLLEEIDKEEAFARMDEIQKELGMSNDELQQAILEWAFMADAKMDRLFDKN